MTEQTVRRLRTLEEIRADRRPWLPETEPGQPLEDWPGEINLERKTEL